MGTATSSTTVRARKPHYCFLCTIPIAKGDHYLRWAWFEDGTASTMRAHPACDGYASSELEYSEGVDDNAVEDHVRENIIRRKDYRVAGVNETEASRLLLNYPGLATLIEKIRTDILKETRE